MAADLHEITLTAAPICQGATRDAEHAEWLRDSIAKELGLDPQAIKPCVAVLASTPQPKGARGAGGHKLAVEFIRAGAKPDVLCTFLGAWAQRCAQPPYANHPFTPRDIAATIRGVAKIARDGRLYGFGCDNPHDLRPFCPYGGGEAGKKACPYLQVRRRPPTRKSTTTLLGAWNLARTHEVPPGWRPRQIVRRRYLMLAIGAVEIAKGHGGCQLFTSTRELADESGIERHTLMRDLRAMATAGWIEYVPGRSRVEIARLAKAGVEVPTRGARIRRLLPGEAAAALVERIFADDGDGNQDNELTP